MIKQLSDLDTIVDVEFPFNGTSFFIEKTQNHFILTHHSHRRHVANIKEVSKRGIEIFSYNYYGFELRATIPFSALPNPSLPTT